jgi:hypothetical protein
MPWRLQTATWAKCPKEMQNAQDEDQVGRQHLIRHTNAQIRDLRGTSTLSSSETQRIKRWMPYG